MQIILGAVFHGVCKGERDGRKRGAAITGSNPQQTSFTEGYSTITAAPPTPCPAPTHTLFGGDIVACDIKTLRTFSMEKEVK